MKITRAKQARQKTVIRFITREDAQGIDDFTAKTNQVAVRYEDGKTIIYADLGPEDEVSAAVARSQAARAIRRAAHLKRGKVSAVLPEAGDDPGALGLACAEGLLLGGYSFNRYLSEKPHEVSECQVVGGAVSPSALKKARAVCQGVFLARDLVNENAESMMPEDLAREARKIEETGAVRVTVLDEKDIQEKGMGLLWAVGRGSCHPPRLILLEYEGAPKSKKKTAIVGKGITFDSGGLNLKPSGSIEEMRDDMAGAAAVLGVMSALAEVRPAINVTGVVAAAHNAIDACSYFPGDVFRSYAGKTVEINNTDAEGRLVLADAAAYCADAVKPSEIIDLATLTGGILIALGPFAAGLFANDDRLAEDLFKAGEAANERLWRLPLYPEYAESLKGHRSDLCNLSRLKRGHASSPTGAAFIGEFVRGLPWAHLDIAGTAYRSGPARGELPRMGTGFGVRLLMQYLAPMH